MERFETQLGAAEPRVRELIGRIPPQETPPLPSTWLRCEILERFRVLRLAPDISGKKVLEVGSGAHAISTVPLAASVGPEGRVVAAERARWSRFRPVVDASGLGDRIWPVACDARRLPLRSNAAELAACVHGIRSLGDEDNIVRVLREMLRVAPHAFLAESLPVARTQAQRAHLTMYDLREELFSITTGARDDRHYLPLDHLASLAERAGGVVERSETLEVDLPHFLAYFPRSLVEAFPTGERREDLLRRWDEADGLRRRYGEDHPPVGVVSVARP